MRYRITHTTTYLYTEPVTVCQNETRLTPLNYNRQQCLSSRLRVLPKPSDYHEWVDFYGNKVNYFEIQNPHTKLEVTAISEVVVAPESMEFEFSEQDGWQAVVEQLELREELSCVDACQYRLNSPMVSTNRELAAYAERSFTRGRPIVDAVHDLMERIHRDFVYDPGFTTLATPLQEVLKHRRGVCQDFAHLAIGCLRSLGLAARYVSGYIETLPAAGQEKLIGADASHAWFSVYVPKVGWLDFDPTNNQMPMDKHIIVACGRDYSDVTPLKGVVFGGGEHRLNVAVTVENVANGS